MLTNKETDKQMPQKTSTSLHCATLVGNKHRVAPVIMVDLCNRADHYIFALWFLSFFLFFFPRLISAIAEWMSAIIAHMVWPWCEFKMQVGNVLHAARWKYRTQKSRQKSPSGNHRTTLSGYIFATKARINNPKKLVKQQYVLQMFSDVELWPTSGWDQSGSLGHPS